MNKKQVRKNQKKDLPICLPRQAYNAVCKLKLKEIENDYLLYNRFSPKKGKHKPDLLANANVVKSTKIPKVLPEIKKLAESFPFHRSFKFIPYGKLAVGTGSQSPFDTTSLITLHPIYGIPYIPGSAIKGVVRNCYIQHNFGGKESEAFKNETFVKLFGIDVGNNSDVLPAFVNEKLIFFDAFPESYELRYDVQTPHFKDYYDRRGKINPLDTIKPIPLHIPVVERGSFTIHICGYNKQFEFKCIENIIKDAFEKHGIGAKTALGYGLGEIKIITDEN